MAWLAAGPGRLCGEDQKLTDNEKCSPHNEADATIDELAGANIRMVDAKATVEGAPSKAGKNTTREDRQQSRREAHRQSGRVGRRDYMTDHKDRQTGRASPEPFSRRAVIGGETGELVLRGRDVECHCDKAAEHCGQ